MTYDLMCVGAGPTGLACAMEAKRAGMRRKVERRYSDRRKFSKSCFWLSLR